MSSNTPTIHRHLPPNVRSLPGDVRTGLSSTPKAIPPKHFYDQLGSELFEQITLLPEYYPTRAEQEILKTSGAQLAELCPGGDLVELGSGAAEKALSLIDPMSAAGTLRSYTAVDVSESALLASLEQISAIHPELVLEGHVADMTRQLELLPPATDGRTVALLGGTLGNFAPEPRRTLLADMAALAGHQGRLLIGFDLVKDPSDLVRAYDDSQGVTASFNLNLLDVINRDLGANFARADFEHVAVWNPSEEWIEMRLRALRDVTVELPALELEVQFSAGEELLTETSAKFSQQRIANDLAAARLEPLATLTDSQQRFAVVVAASGQAADRRLPTAT